MEIRFWGLPGMLLTVCIDTREIRRSWSLSWSCGRLTSSITNLTLWSLDLRDIWAEIVRDTFLLER